MAAFIGHTDNIASYQKMKAGYDNAEKFIEITGAKKRALSAMDDGLKNVQALPLLLSEKKSGSGPLNVLVKLNSVKRDVLQMMNKLPVEVHIEIADKIPDAMVIHGDGRSIELLEEENIDSIDAFIAVTEDSETNIMTCLMAKSKKVKKTIALVENMDYFQLSNSIGIDTLINKKLLSKLFEILRINL